MAGKVLQLDIKIDGKLDPSVQAAFGKLAAMANKSAGKMQMQNISKGINQVHGIATKAMAFAGGALIGVGAAASIWASKSIKSAKAAIEAETKLGAVLQNNIELNKISKTAYIVAQKNLVNQAAKLQRIGVIADDITVAGFQQLATFQLSDREITTMQVGFTDLLAQQKGLNATQEDAVTIANMIGKAIDGNAGAMRRVGITFTKAQEQAIKLGNKTQRAAIIAEVLQQNVGGVNKALAETDQGKIQQSANILDDMQEKIGGKLLPVIAKLATKMLPFIEMFVDKLLPALDSADFDKGINAFISGLETGFKVASSIFDFIINNGALVKGILIGLAVAYGVLTVAQIAFNIAQMKSPMVWIILGIMAAIALLAVVIYKLATDWDGSMQYLSGVWGAFLGYLSWAWDVTWNGIILGLKGFVNMFIFLINGMIGSYLLGINQIINGINAVSGALHIPAIPNIPVPMIPYLAAGLTTAGPMLAMIGEAGTETVVPHNSKPRSQALALEAAQGAGLFMGDTKIEIYISMTGGSKEEAREVGDELESRLDRYFANKRRVSFA